MRQDIQEIIDELIENMKGMGSKQIWKILEKIYYLSECDLAMRCDKEDVRKFPDQRLSPEIEKYLTNDT